LVDARECASMLHFAALDLTVENYRAACGQHRSRFRRETLRSVSASTDCSVPFNHSPESAVMTTRSSSIASRKDQLDGRTLGAKRRRELIAGYVSVLGGADQINSVQMAHVERVAELAVLAEQLRAKAMRGEADGAGELSALVRLESTIARGERLLGLKPGHSKPAAKSLAEHLAQRAARAAGASSGEAA
jgi:hypothetical protein